MPGVADAVKQTQLKQDQKSRKRDMEELLTLVKEGRIHEADERQLEMLKLSLELNSLVVQKETAPVSVVNVQQNSKEIVDAIREALAEVVSKMSKGGIENNTKDSNRPEMKHSSLTTFKISDPNLNLSHTEGLGETKEGKEESTDKLKKLRKIKESK